MAVRGNVSNQNACGAGTESDFSRSILMGTDRVVHALPPHSLATPAVPFSLPDICRGVYNPAPNS